MEASYGAVVALGKTLIRVMRWQMVVSGLDHLPARGPAILAPNHVSYVDPIILEYGATLRRRYVRFLAKQELFDVPGWGWFMRSMKHVPVDRHGSPGQAYRAAIDALGRGEIVAVFPEATISPAFVPAEGKTGAARMAIASGVPVIPVALWGGQRVATKGRPPQFRRRIPLTCRFGDPVTFDAGDDAVEGTARLIAHLRDLVERAAAEYPDQPSGPDDRWWLPHHLGGTAPSVEEAAELMRRSRVERAAARRQRGMERA